MGTKVITIDGIKYNEITFENGSVIHELYQEKPLEPEKTDSEAIKELNKKVDLLSGAFMQFTMDKVEPPAEFDPDSLPPLPSEGELK